MPVLLTFPWQYRLVKLMWASVLLTVITGLCFILLFMDDSLINNRNVSIDMVMAVINYFVGAFYFLSVVFILVYFAVYHRYNKSFPDHTVQIFLDVEIKNVFLSVLNYIMAAICIGYCVYVLVVWSCSWPYRLPEYLQPVLVLLLPHLVRLVVRRRPLPDYRMLYIIYAAAICLPFAASYLTITRSICAALIFNISTVSNASACYRGEFVSMSAHFPAIFSLTFFVLTTVQLAMPAFAISHNLVVRQNELETYDNNIVIEQEENERFSCVEQCTNVRALLCKYWFAVIVSVIVIASSIVLFTLDIVWPTFVPLYWGGLLAFSILASLVTVVYWIFMERWRPIINALCSIDGFAIVFGSASELLFWLYFTIRWLIVEGPVHVLPPLSGCFQLVQTYSQFVMATEILQQRSDTRQVRHLHEVYSYGKLAVPSLILMAVNAAQTYTCLMPIGGPFAVDLVVLAVRLFYRFHAVSFFLNVVVNTANGSFGLKNYCFQQLLSFDLSGDSR